MKIWPDGSADAKIIPARAGGRRGERDPLKEKQTGEGGAPLLEFERATQRGKDASLNVKKVKGQLSQLSTGKGYDEAMRKERTRFFICQERLRSSWFQKRETFFSPILTVQRRWGGGAASGGDQPHSL